MKKSDIAYMSREELENFIRENYGLYKDLMFPIEQKLFFRYRQTCELRELALSLCDD